jgi:TPR repeat protein
LRSAKQNSAGAATNLGALYINGWGGKVDLDQGKYWMMRAASQDEDQKAKTTGIKSLRLIAYLKKNDISIAQAKKISAQNMIHALCEKGEHGDVKAQVALGYYYLRGIKASANGEYVFQPNNKASIYWLEKAAGNGSYEAKTYLQSKDMKVLEDAVDQNEYKVE